MAYVSLLEDNARLAKLCATMLQFAGHKVAVYDHPQTFLSAFVQPVSKGDGKIGTLTIAPTTFPVDVVILDLQLPDMSGIEVVHQLQKLPQTQNIPLIFCTAATSQDIARALQTAPYASVVEKPFKLDTLVSAVTLALHKQDL